VKILVYGDPHGKWQPLHRAAAANRPDLVVLLGDMDLEAPLEEMVAGLEDRVWWIGGNHEADRPHWYQHAYGSAALAERCLDGRVVEIDGVRLAGLGGVFKQRVWHPETGINWPSRKRYLAHLPPRDRAKGLPLHVTLAIWHEDYECLYGQRADLLFTHEAPSCHRYGFAALDELAEAMGVKLLVHGHHHETYRAELAPCPVYGLGRAMSLIIQIEPGQAPVVEAIAGQEGR
jgi:predicted phosphodiesterase